VQRCRFWLLACSSDLGRPSDPQAVCENELDFETLLGAPLAEGAVVASKGRSVPTLLLKDCGPPAAAGQEPASMRVLPASTAQRPILARFPPNGSLGNASHWHPNPSRSDRSGPSARNCCLRNAGIPTPLAVGSPRLLISSIPIDCGCCVLANPLPSCLPRPFARDAERRDLVQRGGGADLRSCFFPDLLPAATGPAAAAAAPSATSATVQSASRNANPKAVMAANEGRG
jgi:hypothetical protein